MADLDLSLKISPIPPEAQPEFIRSLWDCNANLRVQVEDLDWDAYFDYCSRQCHLALRERGRHLSARTNQDIIDVVDLLKQDLTKDEIKKEMFKNCTSQKPAAELDSVLEGSINLAIRLLLMIDVGVLQHAFSGRTPMVWENKSLKSFVADYFDELPILGHDNVKIEKLFNAYNLKKIAGIDIEWTDNLTDHLRMIGEDDKKVAVFHYASFLKIQQE